MSRRWKMPRENNADAPRHDGPGRSARGAGCCAGIFVLALLVYWPALRGEFLWDDPAHVTRAELREWDGLRRIFFEPGATQEYYPVLHGAFWIQHRLWGDAVVPYYLLNILLHATNGCLLALLLRRMWTKPANAPDAATSGARTVPRGTEWLAAFLFVVHPVCVESVAWITEQKNTLSLLFYLLAALLYLDFCAARRTWQYGLALGFFLLALGAKTMTVTLPAAILVVRWWQSGRLSWRRDVSPLLPWFAVAIGAGLVTTWMETTWVGAQGRDYALTFVQRVLLASRIFWFSLGKLLWPADLTFFYPRWEVATQAQGWTVHLVAGMAATLAFWFLRRRSRAPLAVWLLYGGTLFPVLGFFNVFSFSFSYVADHYQYLAIPIVISAAAAGLAWGLAKLPARFRTAGRVATGALVSVLSLLSLRQSRHYQDDETLFRANIAVNPTSWMGHHILAQTLVKKSPEHHAEAEALFRRALQLKASNPDSHYTLGMLLAKRPETQDEAIQHLQEALRLRPAFTEAHHGLAVTLSAMPGRLMEAINHYQSAVQLRPDFGYAHANLAQALTQVPGRETEALAHFDAALRRLPYYAPAHYNLANLLASLPGRQAEAIPHYEAALRGWPDAPEVHYNLANVLAQLPDRLPDAISHYESALRLRPDVPEVHANLANALALQPKRLAEALAHYETALRLNPDLAWVHYNLALHLGKLPGRETDALEHGEAALRLRPDYLEARNLLGILLAQSGQADAARAQWNEALRIDPEFTPARENLKRLEQDDRR